MDGTHFLPLHLPLLPGTLVPRAMAPMAPACVVTNWTVKKAGTTKAPTSNDYDAWSLDQLRKECTARGLKIKRTIDDESGVRRHRLREHDLQRLPPTGGTDANGSGSGSGSGSTHASGSGSVKGVAVVAPRQHEWNKESQPLACGAVVPVRVATPRVIPAIVPDDDARLSVEMRTAGIGRGHTAIKTGRATPIHRVERPQASTNSLQAPVQVAKPFETTRTSTKRAVLATHEEIRPSAPATSPVSPSTTKRSLSEVLDCMQKTYTIRSQLHTAKHPGDEDPVRQRSLALVEAGLRVLEHEYAVAMGLDKPGKKPRTVVTSKP